MNSQKEAQSSPLASVKTIQISWGNNYFCWKKNIFNHISLYFFVSCINEFQTSEDIFHLIIWLNEALKNKMWSNMSLLVVSGNYLHHPLSNINSTIQTICPQNEYFCLRFVTAVCVILCLHALIEKAVSTFIVSSRWQICIDHWSAHASQINWEFFH